MSSVDTRARLQTAAPWLGLALLDVLLFVPMYALSAASFWPDLPEQFGWRTFKVLALRRSNLDLFRVSFDVILLALAMILTAELRARTVIRRSAVAFYVALLVFVMYHDSVALFFNRKPALGEDWRFLLNLSHLLASVMSPRWAAILGGGLLALVAVTFLAAFTFGALQRTAAGWSRRRRATIAAALVVPCALAFASVGVAGRTPVLQLMSRRVTSNWQASRAEAKRLSKLHERTPDRRYDPFLDVSLARKPNFYLLMIEAYGEVLATWDMRDAYRVLLDRVQQRLTRAGYHATSAYSAAPVHGGTSWFSISTVHTGTKIDRPIPYAALQLVGARVPSITKFFASQGYRTYSLAPGNSDHVGLNRLDIFNHDVIVDNPALAYGGWLYGWGLIPDQFSWSKFRERWFAKPVEPYYVYYMAVSTHWAWEGVPPYVDDWHTLEQYDVPPEKSDPSWPRIRETKRIRSDLRRAYFRSVEYEWRVLLDQLEADQSPNIVVAIVGDHQPALEAFPGEVTMNTPVHMLSRDPKLIERFTAAGFTPGLWVEPKQAAPLAHEGLFSLWVSELTAEYGAPGSERATYYPQGIRLSTLSR